MFTGAEVQPQVDEADDDATAAAAMAAATPRKQHTSELVQQAYFPLTTHCVGLALSAMSSVAEAGVLEESIRSVNAKYWFAPLCQSSSVQSSPYRLFDISQAGFTR